jgi:chromate transporter
MLSPFLPALSQSQDIPLWKLGLFFLKVGTVLYGSGYVLIAFLEGDLVQNYGWLTQQQLLDAIAIGQFTPGPVLTTATFIGYVLAGIPGAIVATLGIFLPSFIFVAILNPIIPKLRNSKWTAAFLDAVNVSAVALMLVVTVRLGLTVLTAWPAWVIFGLAVTAVLRFKLNAAYLVLGGAMLGWALGLI